MKYRGEIDGLRAIAVLPVILFHTGFESFSGGFLGVDVFFVISGFLITKIISDELEQGAFSVLKFYEKRARRILPALYVMLVACAIYAAVQTPFAARDLYQSIAATTIFSENILLYVESSDYFDLETERKPLLHMWTLGVEEQFYITFPFLLIIAKRFSGPLKFHAFLSLLAASFTAALILTPVTPHFSFFMIFTRGWELLLGVLAAFVSESRIQGFSITFRNLAALLGLGAILVAVVLVETTTATPHLSTLFPTLGAACVILFAGQDTFVGRFLNNKAMVGIGLISFSLYLWHQPIIVFFMNEVAAFGTDLKLHHQASIIALTICISLASYFFIESPARNNKKFPNTKLKATLIVTSIALFSLGYLGNKTIGFENLKLDSLPEHRQNFYISHFTQFKRVKNSEWGKETDPTLPILVIGDSMGSDTMMSLRAAGLGGHRVTLDGSCFEELIKNENACGETLQEIRELAKDRQAIILASDFSGEQSQIGVEMLFRELAPLAPTYVLGSFRFLHASDISFRFARSNRSSVEEFFHANLDPRDDPTNSHIRQAVGLANVINKQDFFCTEGKCKLYNAEGQPLFYDSLHLTVEGWQFFGERLRIWLSTHSL